MSSTRRRERRERKGGVTTATARATRFFSDVREAVGGTPSRGGAPHCCVLCGSPRVAYGGLWFPTAAVGAKLLVPSDKQRLIGYGLCADCFRSPDAGRRVEDAILADFAEFAASPSCN